MCRHQNPPPDWILAPPQSACGALTDDCDTRRRRLIQICEKTAALEGDLHRREVARCCDLIAELGVQTRTVRRVRLSFQDDCAFRADGSKRQWTKEDGSGALDLRQRRDPGK